MLDPVRLRLRGAAWVIVDGESGPGAHATCRPSGRVTCQCKAANVRLLMKQMSRRVSVLNRNDVDLTISKFPPSRRTGINNDPDR
jgi:protein gp37